MGLNQAMKNDAQHNDIRDNGTQHKRYLHSNQCDQIGQNITVWLLFAWAFFKIYLNKQFQNMVCCIYFNVQKQFDVTILAFECEL
jgi:hypothetical protein